MNETESAIQETEAEMSEIAENVSGSDDWDSIDLSDLTEDSEVSNGGDEAEDGDHTDEAEAFKPAQGEQAEEQKADTDQYTLKHLDEIRTVSRDEVIALAQKGIDYDRLKAKIDEKDAKDAEFAQEVEFVHSLAKEQGLGLKEFVDNTRAAIIAKRENIPVEQALNRIKLERREAELEKKESKLKEQAAAKTEEDKASEKRDRDIREFISEYKDVDFKSIPKEVWDDVLKGKTLTDAYRKYENKVLREKLAAAQKREENALKSTGSRKSTGQKKTDDFDALWYDGT